MALETPLGGRFLKEGRILFFGPPPWYMQLMWATVGAGAAMALYGLFEIATHGDNAFYFGGVGFMLLFAGFWAFGSLQRITFDIRAKTYRRWHGPGFLPRLYSGPLESLHSMALMAEDRFSPTGRSATYRLVLYWKNPREPLMVVQQHSVPLQPGMPLNAGVQTIGSLGWEYARALGIPFQDVSHQHQPCPIPVFA